MFLFRKRRHTKHLHRCVTQMRAVRETKAPRANMQIDVAASGYREGHDRKTEYTAALYQCNHKQQQHFL